MSAGDPELVAELLTRGFYSTAYQPIFDTCSEKPYGFEALLRGPDGTPLENPGRLFDRKNGLPSDLLLKLDSSCIESAVRTGRNLPGTGRIFINILSNTLKRLSYRLEEFICLLSELNIKPDRIVFELSENTTHVGINNISKHIVMIRNSGINIALDDIGVRSPYLYHLLYLEPEFLKVDRMFIHGIDSDKRKEDLVCCMAYMADKMGTKLIAEGVETRREFQTVKKIGVPFSQGFYLGYPLPAERWLDSEIILCGNVHG